MIRVTNTWAKSSRRTTAPAHLRRGKIVRLGLLSLRPGRSVDLTDDLAKTLAPVIDELRQYDLIRVEDLGGEKPAPEPKPAPEKPEEKSEEKPEEIPEEKSEEIPELKETAEEKPAEKPEEKPEEIAEEKPGEKPEEKPEEKPKKRGRRKKGAK